MRDSPFQLLESFFQKVTVEVTDPGAPREKATQFEKMELQFFDLVERLDDFWQGSAPTDTAAANTYKVTLGVRTAEEGTAGAYTFEIIVTGVVACMKANPQWTQGAAELAHEYGKALLLGMAREQLASMTARMLPGIRLLPTVNFLSTNRKVETEPAAPGSSK